MFIIEVLPLQAVQHVVFLIYEVQTDECNEQHIRLITFATAAAPSITALIICDTDDAYTHAESMCLTTMASYTVSKLLLRSNLLDNSIVQDSW